MSTDARRDELLFARLLCDAMIPAELSEALRAQGYDVAEARLLPMEVQQDDDALLKEATRQERTVVTCNYSDPRSNFCVMSGGGRRARSTPAFSWFLNTRSVAARFAGRSVTECSSS